MRLAVVTPDPAQWVHVRALDEVAEVVHAGLIELGIECERSVGRFLEGHTNVVFGAHLPPAPAGRALLRKRPQAELLAPAVAALGLRRSSAAGARARLG